LKDPVEPTPLTYFVPTVYVLPDATRVVSVRWSPRPEPDERTLTWSVED